MTDTATAVFSVDGLELSRVVANALVFLPARSRFGTARLEVTPGGIRATATDSYAVGTDTCVITEYAGQPEPFWLELNRDGLAALDKIGRTDRKVTRKPVTVTITAATVVASVDDQAETAEVVAPTPDSHALWDACDNLLERLNRTDAALPQTIAFDPTLLSRFAKVRADKTERVADFLIFDNEAPVLVRIGPSFVGAVMPIHRSTHAENVGADGLWDTAA